jgi:unsaturated rhamnogalacturonyl hydrolase
MGWDRYFQQYIGKRFPEELEARQWSAPHDLCMGGLDQLYAATGQDLYLLAMLFARPYLLTGDHRIPGFSTREHRLDAIGVGKSLLILYRRTQDFHYLSAAMQCFRHLQSFPRTQSGGFSHRDDCPYQIRLDGLYAALPFYARCEILNGTLQVQDILRQFEAARKRLYAEETGLYLHAWDESRRAAWADPRTGRSPAPWLRAEGLLLMALCDCYELLKDITPEAAALCRLLTEALDGLTPYRDGRSGMFLQIPDRPDAADNYPETAGNAMVAYGMMKGARLRMTDARYVKTGRALLDAVERHSLGEKGGALRLRHICADLEPGQDDRGGARHYLNGERIPDGPNGVGACMLAYAEALRTGGGIA